MGQTVFGRNLVQNPGAEAGQAIASVDETRVAIPNWTATGTMTAVKYDSSNFLDSSAYGPGDRGKNYFAVADAGNASTATQTVDLAGGAAEIDAGRVRFFLSGYLGGTPYVKGALRAVFLDASGGTLLETAASAPADDGSGEAVLFLRTASGFLLPNTRSVKLVLELQSTTAGFGYASADNLSFALALEPVLGQNLVVNGDAETDAGEESMSTWSPISGWNTPTGMMAVRYSATGFAASDPLPENRGRNLFAAYNTVTRSAFQTIDVTLAKERIDSGGVGYQLSGFLGGYGDYPDQARLALAFLDAGGRELGKAEVGPVTLQDRGGKSGLLRRAGEGAVPSGTRQLHLTLWMTFLGDPTTNIYAHADNISLVLTSGAGAVSLNRISNAASGATGAVAPGGMVALAVSGVTLDSRANFQLDSQGRVAKELAGVKVFFDGTQAPLLYVQSSQIGAVVPFDVDGKTSTQVRVEYQGVRSNTVAAQVARTAPGVFTQEGGATGRGLIYGDTWTLNSAASPAAKGSVATILWTGGGQTNPAGVDGRIETQSLPRVAQPVTVSIGGQNAEVVYAGGVYQGWAGLLMVQARVPAAAAAGDAVPVTVTVGGSSSQAGVTMAVR
ncbi:MAG: hypothetical protein IT429_16405 [Gemmataceae bacterium]|nr:hypothetical protein [Gemmataceae bacterium]